MNKPETVIMGNDKTPTENNSWINKGKLLTGFGHRKIVFKIKIADCPR